MKTLEEKIISEFRKRMKSHEKKMEVAGVGTINYNHTFYLAAKKNFEQFLKDSMKRVREDEGGVLFDKLHKKIVNNPKSSYANGYKQAIIDVLSLKHKSK